MIDELDELTFQELEELINFFHSNYYDLLRRKYKPLRENYISKLTRRMTPTSGELAMFAIGKVQGKDEEIEFFFNRLKEECQNNLKKRSTVKPESVSEVDSKKPINLITNY